MKLNLSIFTFFISCSLFAQTTPKTVLDRTFGMKETYYVLKSDTGVRQGAYTLNTVYGDRVLREGVYKNNQKDSIWNSYNYKGELQVKYDYTHKTLLLYKEDERWKNEPDHKFVVINGKDTSYAKLDQPPVYLDGNGKYTQILIKTIRYPKVAKEKNIQGKVVIAFTIDTAGNISNFRVKKSIGGGCDEEALRVNQMIKGEWLPGMLNGKPVTTEFEIPTSFTLVSDDK